MRALIHRMGPLTALPPEEQRRIRAAEEREVRHRVESARAAYRAAAGVPRKFREAALGETGWLEEVPGQYVQLARRLAQLPQQPATLAICGGYATGKTGLACAAVNHFVGGLAATDEEGQPRPLKARYCKAFNFFQDLKSAIGAAARETVNDVFRRYLGYELLVIDEITVRSDTEWENITLRQLIDDRANDLKSTILLGNIAKADLSRYLGDAIAARINRRGGGGYDIPWPPLWVKGEPRPAGPRRANA